MRKYKEIRVGIHPANTLIPNDLPEAGMKNKIMIVEDNYYRFFTTKNIIESHMRINVEVVTAENRDELLESTVKCKPTHVIFRPKGGVVEIVDYLSSKKANCRNTEITILLIPEEAVDFQNIVNNAKSKRCSMVTLAA